ncbi:hypothetical protein [Xylanimonas ulmi]|uniref:hypothetical protein n=1 Tax=Xylanimonas ulmi TaxID=228973 RepID=UPI001A90D624|nr:hypothetical protein [Xylanibacterium ulmi]
MGLHEAAHSALHADDADGEYVRHRGIKETEAESVAYVSAGLLGLDTSTYSIGYIAGWSDCDPQVIKDTASRVLRCAHTFVEALTEPPVVEPVEATPRIDPADLDPSNLNPPRVGMDAAGALSL